MLTDIDLAYIAGFFDGEGCISLCKVKDDSYRRNYNYMLAIHVSNTKLEILEMLHREFGGHFQRIKNKTTPNGKEIYVWALTRRIATRFIKAIYPYLRMKRRQAELALEYRKLINPYGNHSFDPENWKKRDAIYHKLKTLNKRGDR